MIKAICGLRLRGVDFEIHCTLRFSKHSGLLLVTDLSVGDVNPTAQNGPKAAYSMVFGPKSLEI